MKKLYLSSIFIMITGIFAYTQNINGGKGKFTSLSVSGNIPVIFDSVKIAGLSGTGDRQVYVDANGNLKIQPELPFPCIGLDTYWKTGGNNLPGGTNCHPFIGSTNAADLIFKTDAANDPDGGERMRITANGNVGIGTSDPQHQLHLNSFDPNGGDASRLLPLDSTLNFDSLGNYIPKPIQTEQSYKTFQITNNSTGVQSINGLLMGLSGTAGFLELQEQNQLLIKSHGGISLYTTSGNVVLGGYGSSGIVQLHSPSNILFGTGTSATGIKMIIRQNGNVGIGTGAPNVKFEVQSSGSINEIAASFSENSARKIFVVPHLSGYGYNNSSAQDDAGIFWTDGIAGGHNQRAGFVIGPWDGETTSGLRLTHDGNVGIGTSNPLEKLSVNGNVRIGSDPPTPYPANSYYMSISDKGIETGNTIGRSAPLMLNYSGNDVMVGNYSNTTRDWLLSVAGMIITRGDATFHGKVVIGNQTIPNPYAHSDFQLAVAGKIVSKSTYVTVSNWQDAVFNNDYQLMSLERVEEYYTKNKHLPEYPAEKEIIDNGLDLGNIARLQQKSIEEMVLYLVEMKKEINLLKETNVQLKNEIQKFKTK